MFPFEDHDLIDVVSNLFDKLYYMYHVDILDAPSYSVTAEENIMTAYYDNIAYEHKLDGEEHQTIPIGKVVM